MGLMYLRLTLVVLGDSDLVVDMEMYFLRELLLETLCLNLRHTQASDSRRGGWWLLAGSIDRCLRRGKRRDMKGQQAWKSLRSLLKLKDSD